MFYTTVSFSKAYGTLRKVTFRFSSDPVFRWRLIWWNMNESHSSIKKWRRWWDIPILVRQIPTRDFSNHVYLQDLVIWQHIMLPVVPPLAATFCKRCCRFASFNCSLGVTMTGGNNWATTSAPKKDTWTQPLACLVASRRRKSGDNTIGCSMFPHYFKFTLLHWQRTQSLWRWTLAYGNRTWQLKIPVNRGLNGKGIYVPLPSLIARGCIPSKKPMTPPCFHMFPDKTHGFPRVFPLFSYPSPYLTMISPWFPLWL